MNNQDKNNQFLTPSIIIGLVGLVLMFTVIFSHKHINAQFSYIPTNTFALEAEELIEPELEPLPEEALEEIIYSDVNIMGLEEYNQSKTIMSPAFQFLRSITSSKFLTQK